MQCSAVQCIAVQCSTVQYSTVQYSTVQCSFSVTCSFECHGYTANSTAQCNMYTDRVHCTLCTVHCALYIVPCTWLIYIVHCTLCSVYCVLYILPADGTFLTCLKKSEVLVTKTKNIVVKPIWSQNFYSKSCFGLRIIEGLEV